MRVKAWLLTAQGLLDVKVVTVGATTVTLGTLVTVLIVVLVTTWLSRFARRRVADALLRRGGKASTVGSVSSLINYSILLTGLGVALDTIGLDLGALFAAGALFAVAIGFAMQNIAQNFVSGIILMTERSINPGDVLEVDGLFVRIEHMGIRASMGRTRDGEDVIIPNATLVQNNVKNLSVEESSYRLRTSVGVAYDSDMARVREVLEDTVTSVPWRDTTREPRVWMTEFGNHAVNFEVGVWIHDPYNRGDALSDLNEAIWAALKEAEIVIAFPQLDVHFDPGFAPSAPRA
ncbi:MAG: mechanosensitive ion channel [Polyangiaceae bacterium]